jgi:hypothetical protein
MSNNRINVPGNFSGSGEAAAVPGKALGDALAANTILAELDLSSNYLRPEFARNLAVGIGDNWALSITPASLVAFYEQHNQQNVPHVGMTLELFSTQQILAGCEDRYGATPVTTGNKGAMTSLNLSSNKLGSEGAVHIAEAIKVRNCEVAVVFDTNSCRSDLWFNCCCLLISIEYGGTIGAKFG